MNEEVRVFALAKHFGIDSRRMMAILAALGEPPKSASSIIGVDTVRLLYQALAEAEGVNGGTGYLKLPAHRLGRGNGIWVIGRGLTQLPVDMPDRGQVVTIELHSGSMSAIGPNVSVFRSLKVLNLANAGLRRVNAAVSRLPQLEQLILSSNELTELPPELGETPKLTYLDVQDNRLVALPKELAPLLRRGLQLKASGNRFPEPLLSLLERGESSIAAYLESLSGSTRLFEARVMLVGEGNVGKSSLLAAMQGQPFVADRPTTHGIEIGQLELEHAHEKAALPVRVWDFGGQEVYRITHQFFYSPGTLFLLVWRPREGRQQSDIVGWLRRLRLRVGANARILIVATYGDERRVELDLPALKREFGGMIVDHVTVDNSSGANIDRLKELVRAHLSSLPHVGQSISLRWSDVRERLVEAGCSRPYMPVREYFDMCNRSGVPEAEQAALLDLCHDLGQVIYFSEDEGLRDLVILQPEWLSKAIGIVLEDHVTRSANGVLLHSHLREIWRAANYADENHPYFLRLMEKFDVCYRMRDDETRSLVAQLVPFERPQINFGAPRPRPGPRPPTLRRLRLNCALSDGAPGLIAWLTVRNHEYSVGKHWRNGVFLVHPKLAYDSSALIELSEDERLLRLEVSAPSPDFFFNVLRDSIETLLRRRWPGLRYRLLVPCPGRSQGTPCAGVFPLDGLLRRREAGGQLQNCLDCDGEFSVDELLTGFAPPTGTFQEELTNLSNRVRDVQSGVLHLETVAAASEASLRRIARAVAMEVTDCPRLFTVTKEAGRIRGLSSDRVRLRLWCENPGSYHPVRAQPYLITEAKAWIRSTWPYVKLVMKALQLAIPLAGAVAGIDLGKDTYELAQHELDLAAGTLDLLQQLGMGDEDEYSGLTGRGSTMSGLEGEALRAFRTFLFDVDPARAFGGLRRVQASTGDFLWVCAEHYRTYDPGLPTL
ncbi:translation initiation factor IF-2 N-terminal domain-containing protein [Jatrophihabitans cynanchi]|uniref:non-specific serine/threonine protein kinase n=1 Tax=Jatrophihabitans cynanchi TaxID=2944128 RepID=A0ABY7JTB5_9ACTN|nr:translation initiation factor IF-2 N-terminal domain-containing protein [Jatrophihabitans sp. SB3-54]WAX55810.1 translation initiation factor IF-2 N-terminal domain-containing protein [Jatrophihabitans sp. SB3-54]